ncbi:phenolphthiocerol/phthiocerol polyketide synthase subunit C-like [Mercenaria mercenaria]|uniref:phenolphthiocerol/phthiocerol polyketide synthase subunit C-like n=1 Tax=Mercenaria mercenaria TaxID=6596 RepID=UPI00234E92F7|nr:phenolphthiocerol/phthiocerol polyketide synthase subunit C-like [Mercenaria mercenaria]
MPGMIATRIAYHYNLKGPIMLVDTACSSALTSLKIACESMENGDCSAALVGGMNIVLYPSKTGIYGDKGIMSKDFVCRPFDELGNGTVVGEGIICFYVEPLRSAIECHKHKYAVLKSIAVNSVGKGNGITAPSSSSQVKVIQKALSLANISPSEISFLECHGTGTMLGDRIELSALCEVFSPGSRTDKLAIGSIKSAFGHLDSAAGFAGLLKIIASFMFQNIPTTLNFKRPHSELKKSHLYVPNKIVKWEVNDNQRRIAGLSSFGLTGTNCHAILSDSFPFPSTCSAEKYKVAGYLPLLLSGASYEHVKKQACLHESLVTHTVQR